MTENNETAATQAAVSPYRAQAQALLDATAPGGYVRRIRTRLVEFYPEGLGEDDEPIRAVIQANLTFAEINALPSGPDATFLQIMQGIAPYVLAWNALGIDSDTGELAPIPPPCEGGEDSLRAVDVDVSVWLLQTLKQVHIGDGGPQRKNSKPASGLSAVPSNGNGSDAGTQGRRRNRQPNSDTP